MNDLTNARKFVAKNESVLLRAISDTTQTKVGEATGHDASYISKFLKGDQKISLDEMLKMLESCGLALHRMSEAEVMVPREDLSMYITLAKRHMAAIELPGASE